MIIFPFLSNSNLILSFFFSFSRWSYYHPREKSTGFAYNFVSPNESSFYCNDIFVGTGRCSCSKYCVNFVFSDIIEIQPLQILKVSVYYTGNIFPEKLGLRIIHGCVLYTTHYSKWLSSIQCGSTKLEPSIALLHKVNPYRCPKFSEMFLNIRVLPQTFLNRRWSFEYVNGILHQNRCLGNVNKLHLVMSWVWH